MWLSKLSSGTLSFVDGKAYLDLIFEDGHPCTLSDLDYFYFKYSPTSGTFHADEVNSGPSGPFGGYLTPDFSGIKYQGKNVESWKKGPVSTLLTSERTQVVVPKFGVRSIFDDWKVSMEGHDESSLSSS